MLAFTFSTRISLFHCPIFVNVSLTLAAPGEAVFLHYISSGAKRNHRSLLVLKPVAVLSQTYQEAKS